jgi:hypothetical protein
VATEDRTVILTSVNEAWARPGSLLDIYLESFKNGEDTVHLLDHLLVIALDPAGLRRCVSVHPHCYLLENVTAANLSSATRFMSKQYLELVWTKLSLQQRVLELGYNFLFTVRKIELNHERSRANSNTYSMEFTAGDCYRSIDPSLLLALHVGC